MIAAIVQARMSSRRLPGKVLMPIAGRPMLDWVLDAVGRAGKIDRTVLATSADPSDDPIAVYAEERDVECHRGPLEDVAGRFYEIVEALNPQAFVRLSGDSPMLDHRIVDEVVRAYEPGVSDIITTVFPRTVPNGKSVELVESGAFRRAYPLMDEEEREHVTLHFYRHPEGWQITSLEPQTDTAPGRFTVDTPEDADRIEALLKTEGDV